MNLFSIFAFTLVIGRINGYTQFGDFGDEHGTFWSTFANDEELEIHKKPNVPSRSKFIGGLDVSPYRLPSSIEPVSYNITIHPFFNNFTFYGEETIDVLIHKQAIFNPNDWLLIEINAFDIMINFCAIYIDEMPHAIPMREARVDITTQIVAISFKIKNEQILKYMQKHDLKHSVKAMLYIEYIGIIQIDMKGFYISSFRYEGKMIHNAVTHFEATNARKFYPCFDEPAMKATFTFTLIAPKHATVIGNALAHEKESKENNCYFAKHDGESWECKKVEFETSPKMSTYLTAVAIGDYQFVEGEENDVKQRIYFPVQNPKRASFALHMSLKVLTYFAHLLDMKYPLKKMYSLAVNDFKAGAMENLGMVTYRDIRLMCDEDKSTLSIKQHVALVIAHEFSHQWFGNLVTMSWWSDIWLNEGFAAFMEFVGGDHVHPEYALWDTFFFETHRAMLRDGSAETHQIVLKVEDPTDVRALFDGITYHKGAGVLHMLHAYLGKQTFFHKIQNYLKKYKFSNANTQQLFQELGGQKLIEMMNSWVRQPGTPLIKVESSVVSAHKMRFSLTQERMRPNFGASQFAPARFGSEQTWQIPLKIKNAQNKFEDMDLFKTKSVEFEVTRVYSEDEHHVEYYMLNPSMMSFAFTYYDTLSLNLLIKSFNKLDKIDQFLVIADRFALMNFGFIAADEFVNFLHQIAMVVAIEHNDAVNSLMWRIVIDSLLYIDDIFCELHHARNEQLQSLRLKFRHFARDLLRPVWDKIGGFGRDNNAHEKISDTVMLRPFLVSALVRFDDTDVIDKGFEILEKCLELHDGQFRLDSDGYIDCAEILDRNILEQLLEAGLAKFDAKGDDELVFEEMIAIYSNANNEVQSMILGALGAVYKNARLLQEGVQFVLSHSVRLNVKGHGMASLRRCYGRQLVWKDLLKRSRGAPRQVGMAATFATQGVYNLVYSYFFGSHHGLILKLPESKERIIKTVLEKIALNVKFLRDNKFKMLQWSHRYMKTVHPDHAGYGGVGVHDRRHDRFAAEMDEEGNENEDYDYDYDADDDDEEVGQQQASSHAHGDHHLLKQRAFKKQLNGVTAHSVTLSPRQSLLLMITLFFVIISSCLIALWLYSVHKNTLII